MKKKQTPTPQETQPDFKIVEKAHVFDMKRGEHTRTTTNQYLKGGHGRGRTGRGR